MNVYISNKENKLIAAKGKLDGLNPLNVLNRGYAIAEKDEKNHYLIKNSLKKRRRFHCYF